MSRVFLSHPILCSEARAGSSFPRKRPPFHSPFQPPLTWCPHPPHCPLSPGLPHVGD